MKPAILWSYTTDICSFRCFTSWIYSV